MRYLKGILILFLLFAPIVAVILAYLKIDFYVAAVIGFVYMPFLVLIVGRLIKNKAEYGQFLFVKEKAKTTEALNSGFECPFCGARFSFKRISCPDCGKSLSKHE